MQQFFLNLFESDGNSKFSRVKCEALTFSIYIFPSVGIDFSIVSVWHSFNWPQNHYNLLKITKFENNCKMVAMRRMRVGESWGVDNLTDQLYTYFWLQDISEYFKLFHILQGTSEYFKVIQDISRFSRMIRDISKQFSVLQDIPHTLGYYTYLNVLHILQNISRYFRIFQILQDTLHTSAYFKVCQDILRYFKIFQCTS